MKKESKTPYTGMKKKLLEREKGICEKEKRRKLGLEVLVDLMESCERGNKIEGVESVSEVERVKCYENDSLKGF